MSNVNKEALDQFFRKVISPALKNEKEALQTIKAKQDAEENKRD